jgi:hypothetical protein
MPERLCPYCGHLKPADAFPRKGNRCTACESARVAEWRRANPKRGRDYWCMFMFLHGEELRARRRAKCAANRERERERQRRRRLAARAEESRHEA